MTTYTLSKASPAKTHADAVVVGVISTDKGPRLATGGEDVADAYGRKLDPLLASLGVTGRAGQTATVVTADQVRTPLLVLVGLGDQVTPSSVRRAAGVASRSVPNASDVALALPAESPELVRAVVEGFTLGAYVFDEFKGGGTSKAAGSEGPTSSGKSPRDVVLLSPIARQQEAVAAFDLGQEIAAATIRARTWVNLPANVFNPITMTDAISEQHGALTKGRGAPKVGIQIWDEEQLAADGCGGLLGVGGGSETPPRLVKLTWDPAGATKHIAIIGKGITYDSGGYSIKPAASMVSMKEDMAGAAAAVQATLLAAALGLPVRITTYAAMAENMISGNAMRPGDVLTIHGGTTVEVTNTDAEGRLVMADALVLATEATGKDRPDVVLDIATLTGHMVVGLGDKMAGVMGDQQVVDDILVAAAEAGEPMWQMPIPEEMTERVKSSKIADIAQHDGIRWGGGLFAAAFLREFTGGIPWAHLDIAGPAYNTGGAWNHQPPGGTGFGVATLIDYLIGQAAGSTAESHRAD